jgi:formylmethanofuran dehydrogenase subunit E
MYVCTECGHLFREPVWWVERHGLDTPAYEERYGSPCCQENYVDARRCDSCEEFITGSYVKTNDGKRYCENCYVVMDLGEEDF